MSLAGQYLRRTHTHTTLATNNWTLKLKESCKYHQVMKHLKINLTKYVQDLYPEHYKINNHDKWREKHVHGLEDTILLG